MKSLRIIMETMLVLCIVSCTEKKTVPKLDRFESSTICEIENDDLAVGKITSFSMIDSSHFAIISNYEKVLLYDINGNRVTQIGRTGRARFEYQMPMAVHSYGDLIYVWSANQLRFISYKLDGTPVAQYPYRSALRDFKAAENYLYIYTAGLRDESVIDVYSLEKKSVANAIHPSSPLHRILLSLSSPGPMYVADSSLFFMSKDNLSIYSYRDSLSGEKKLWDVKSKSFSFESANYSTLEKNTPKKLAFVDSNPNILRLYPYGDGWRVLVLNGVTTTIKEGDQERVDNSERYYSIYTINQAGRVKEEHVEYIPSSSCNCISEFDGSLFYIDRISKDGDEKYYLKKIENF